MKFTDYELIRVLVTEKEGPHVRLYPPRGNASTREPRIIICSSYDEAIRLARAIELVAKKVANRTLAISWGAP